jgi:hypothetical protein
MSLEEAVSALAEPGEIVSGFITFVEIAHADGQYSIRVFPDGSSTIWKLEGIVNHAIANGYLETDDEDDEDDCA